MNKQDTLDIADSDFGFVWLYTGLQGFTAAWQNRAAA